MREDSMNKSTTFKMDHIHVYSSTFAEVFIFLNIRLIFLLVYNKVMAVIMDLP